MKHLGSYEKVGLVENLSWVNNLGIRKQGLSFRRSGQHELRCGGEEVQWVRGFRQELETERRQWSEYLTVFWIRWELNCTKSNHLFSFVFHLSPSPRLPFSCVKWVWWNCAVGTVYCDWMLCNALWDTAEQKV